VKILLHDDVTAAGKRRVFVANDNGRPRNKAAWIFRSIDKAENIALIEIPEA
jgi:hypothetical protein